MFTLSVFYISLIFFRLCPSLCTLAPTPRLCLYLWLSVKFGDISFFKKNLLFYFNSFLSSLYNSLSLSGTLWPPTNKLNISGPLAKLSAQCSLGGYESIFKKSRKRPTRIFALCASLRPWILMRPNRWGCWIFILMWGHLAVWSAEM